MKRYLVPILALLCAAGCRQEKNPADFDRFSVELTNYAIDYEGGSASIVVNTNAAWKVSPEQEYDWFTIGRTEGTGVGDIPLAFQKNTGLERSARLTVEASGYDPVTVAIVQEAAKSNMRLGMPFIDTPPYMGVEGSLAVKVPYYNALGSESVLFSLSFSGAGSAGLEAQTVSCSDFAPGEGSVTLAVQGAPGALGPVSVTVEAFGDRYDPVSVRVRERIPHEKYINWNNWSVGWTRGDFNLLRGSEYDDSWTSEAVHATTSGVGTDHKALVSSTSLPGCEDAYLSLVCANPITAAGQASGPTGTPAGLAGYQFNPGYQIQGMVQDDYVFVYIPKVTLAAGGTITLESSLGGATAASCVFIAEYSTDNAAWTAFGDAKTLEVGGTSYAYHFQYLAANSAMRYVYARDAAADPAYNLVRATVPVAVNGPLYVRLRSVGLNGKAEVQTGKGWSDIKFIDISFN